MTKKLLNKKGDLRGMTGNLPETKGETNGNWKGGILRRKDGYMVMRIGIISQKTKGARYKLIHRIIMEKKLGRPLLKNEIVHHKNGDRADNVPWNLEIISQSEHAKIHLEERRRNKEGQLV